MCYCLMKYFKLKIVTISSYETLYVEKKKTKLLTGYHDRFRVSTEAVFQQPSQNRIPVRHENLLLLYKRVCCVLR